MYENDELILDKWDMKVVITLSRYSRIILNKFGEIKMKEQDLTIPMRRKIVVNPNKISNSSNLPTTHKIDKYINLLSMNDEGYRNINIDRYYYFN